MSGLASIELSFHPCNILRDNHAICCMDGKTIQSVIVPGASPGQTKMRAAVRENGDFLTIVNYTIFAAIIDSFMSNLQ